MVLNNAQRLAKDSKIWLGVLILVLLGSGVVALRAFNVFSPAQEEETEVAPPQQVSVAALGRLEPEGEVINVGGPTGDRIAELLVAEGDFVEAGQVLAYLETYGERLAERDYAASQLAAAEDKLQAETQYGQAQIQEAQTRLAQIDEPQALAIEAQRATIRELEAELELVEIDLQRFQDLEREGAISRQELDQQMSETRQVREQLNNARVTLSRLETERDMDLSNARAQVTSQRASMQRSQAQIEVESAARNLQLAEAKLERTIIRAPSRGEILRIITQQGEAVSSEGILEIGDTRQMYVVAEVYETDVGLVELGQPATITSRNGSFDDVLTGQVERIGSQIFKNNILDDDPAANADARVVEVRIRLDDSEPVAKLTNLQVDVRIDVD